LQPNDPIVGSSPLRRPAIQSPNFVHLISGWSINQDGTAEFNGVTINGGQVILVNGSGTVVGTLDGTNGLILYGNGTAINPGMTLTPFGDLVWANFDVNALTAPAIEVGNTGLDVIGGTDTGDAQAAALVVDTHLQGGAISGVQVYPFIRGNNQIGSGNPTPVAETWHNFGLQNGWTQDAGLATFAYQADAFGWVRMKGGIVAGTKTDGTVVASLPAGYRPVKDMLGTVAHNSLTGASRIVIRSATGNIEIYDVSTATGLGGFEQVQFPMV